MLLGRVIGHGTSTIRHRSLVGARLALVQPLRSLSAEPLLALDRLHAAPGDLVLISSDGQGAREMLNDETSPARWSVVGIVAADGGPEPADRPPSRRSPGHR